MYCGLYFDFLCFGVSGFDLGFGGCLVTCTLVFSGVDQYSFCDLGF